MPVNWRHYPANWKQIALITKEAANWICQDCGMQCRRPGEPFDTHIRTMSVHHIDHTPMNVDPINLLALCSGCHLRRDTPHHVENAAKTRRAKKIAQGQLELL